jgi:CarD family transcriptional regulator
VRFEVGDVVVYASHGVGRVASRETRMVLGAEQEMVVLEFADGLTVTLPLERAREQFRPLASEADMRRVRETLREDRLLDEESWIKRRRDTLVKLAAGGAVDLAEIVRDGVSRGRKLTPKGGVTRLSDAEKDSLGKARQLLSGEIAVALGLEPAQAEAWIEEQLSH